MGEGQILFTEKVRKVGDIKLIRLRSYPVETNIVV